MRERAHVREVGPRDGLQMVARSRSPRERAVRVAWQIHALINCTRLFE
jgi:hypothetical protein